MAERESIRERRSKPRAVPAIGTAGEADECSTENPLWLPVPSRPYSIAKRLIDIVFSILALILNAPILIAIALAIRLTSKGPILFRQTRLGYHAKPFTYFKFRTMHSSIEPDVHAN